MHVDLEIARKHAERVLEIAKVLDATGYTIQKSERRDHLRSVQGVTGEYLARAILRYIADTEAK